MLGHDTPCHVPAPRVSGDRVVLGNGRELWLRSIRPEDAKPIDGAFGLLRPEEVRLRYLHMIKALSPDYLHRLTHPVRGRDCVLVAAEPYPPGEALIGAVARLSIDPPTAGESDRQAEFAILVSHFVAGYGLGRLLMKRLIDRARRRRLTRIYGDVLESNRAMLVLARRLGFRIDHETPGDGIARVVLELPAKRTPAPANRPRRSRAS